MKKSAFTFLSILGLLLAVTTRTARADGTSNGVGVSCTCVDGVYSGDSTCTSTSYYQTGINLTTGQVVWTRQVEEFGNCSTQEADQINDCHKALALDPFCHVN